MAPDYPSSTNGQAVSEYLADLSPTALSIQLWQYLEAPLLCASQIPLSLQPLIQPPQPTFYDFPPPLKALSPPVHPLHQERLCDQDGQKHLPHVAAAIHQQAFQLLSVVSLKHGDTYCHAL